MWGQTTKPGPPEVVRRETVEAEVWQWLPNYGERDLDARRKALQTGYARAIDAMSRAALAHAESSGDDLAELLSAGIAVVSGLRYATRPRDEDWGSNDLTFWRHRHDPLYDVRSQKTPDFNRPELEQLVAEYLALPFRWPAFDRTLADVLIALETYQFADEMLNEVLMPEFGPPRSPFKQTHPVIGWFQELGLCLALLLVLCGGAFGLNRLKILNSGWAAGAYLLFGSLFLLAMGWTTLMTPFAWFQYRKRIGNARKLMGLMAETYQELQTDGPVSVAHLRERMRVADAAGVRWPGPLYALLDDLAARGGRL